MYIILVNLIVFILFKTLINKSKYSYFVPCTFNIIMSYLMISYGHNVDEIICGNILMYISLWLCQMMSRIEPTRKGSYSIREDIRLAVLVYTGIIVITIIGTIAVAYVFMIGVCEVFAKAKKLLLNNK